MFKLVSGFSMSVESTGRNAELWREHMVLERKFSTCKRRKKMLSCEERTYGFGKMDRAARGGERSNILEWKVRGLTSFFSGREESRWSEKKKG